MSIGISPSRYRAYAYRSGLPLFIVKRVGLLGNAMYEKRA
jgi:hypothetical protein